MKPFESNDLSMVDNDNVLKMREKKSSTETKFYLVLSLGNSGPIEI